MTESTASLPPPRLPVRHFAIGAVALIGLFLLFQDTFVYLHANWQREEYSHGFLVPLVSAYLIWQKRALLARIPLEGSWLGVAICAIGLGIYFVGSLASITTIDTYALVIVIIGLALAVTGSRSFRLLAGPLAMLFLMNPIPASLFNNLSSALQLVSSKIGVGVIRLFDISVFLQGNVIDLGSYKLQVVEACSGLNYLFPLITLGFIVASLVPAKLWIRAVLVISTVPITVLMNSFRIGVIGVLVDRYGIAQAEGFLHDFEGWIIFMSCFAVLLLETWALLRLSGDRRNFRDLLSGKIDQPSGPALASAIVWSRPGKAPVAAAALVLLAVWPALALPKREELRPVRQDFTAFPMRVSGWEGKRDRIETDILDQLQLDDYVLADYVRPGDLPVNFYVAYYASQRTGQAAHSPSSCLPGAGWRIAEFDQRHVPVASSSGPALRVNRAVIQMGEQRQLVYYWFQQRSRILTSEYAVKWFLLWDSLRLKRSDGALVRLVTPLRTGEPMAAAESRLTQFTQEVAPRLRDFVPN